MYYIGSKRADQIIKEDKKMNAKKLIALLLAVVMCFGLVACADSGKDPATTTAPDTATDTPSTKSKPLERHVVSLAAGGCGNAPCM